MSFILTSANNNCQNRTLAVKWSMLKMVSLFAGTNESFFNSMPLIPLKFASSILKVAL